MKKTLLIVGGIALVFILLVVRLFVVEYFQTKAEKEWFAREIRYEFSARIDSVWMYNQTGGKLFARVTAGNPRMMREDSLKKFFKQHDQIYLLLKQSSDTIGFILPYANQVKKGDSIRMSSQENTIRVFRGGKEIVAQPMSESLIAFQKPPFVK